MGIRHKKVSGINDNGVPAQVQPSNWNDEHEVDGLVGALLALAATPNTVPYIDNAGSGGAFLISDWARTTLMQVTDPAGLISSFGLAPILSPNFLGFPTVPDAPLGDSTDLIANTKFVQNAIAALVDSSPGALDTLNELAAALGDDPNFATTMTNQLALKAPLASPTFTGTPAAPTAAADTSTTQLATTAFVIGQGSTANPAMDGTAAPGTSAKFSKADHVHPTDTSRAPLNSPVFTGNPQAPTPSPGDNDTSIATTAFVAAALAALTNSVASFNAIDNGSFEIWQRGVGGPLSSPAGSRTIMADRWFVRPAGAAVTQNRSASVPSNPTSRFSHVTTGNTSVTTVDVGQRMPQDRVFLVKRQVTIQAWILNSTGASITPTLLLGTPAALNDFTTVTNRLTQALQACANGVWTQVSHTVDISAFTNIGNGMELAFQFASGTMNSNTKSVQIAEVQISPVPTVVPFIPEKREDTMRACQRHYTKTFKEETVPAQSAGEISNAIIISSTGTAAGNAGVLYSFPQEMFNTPTIVTFNPSAANANLRNLLDGTDVAVAIDQSRKGVRVTINAACADAKPHGVHLTAEIEL